MTQFVPNVVGNFFGYIGFFIGGMNFVPVYAMMRSTLREEKLLALGIILIFAVAVAIIMYMLRKQITKAHKNPIFNQILFGISFAFVSLLPFLPLGNIADRYLYLASVGFCLVFIVILKLLIAAIPALHSYGRWVAAILVLLLVGWYYTENVEQQAKWKKAGEITFDTLLLLRANADKFNPTANLYFVNTPVTYDGVWVYPTGVKDGMWFIYRESMPKVYNATTVQEARDTIRAIDDGTFQNYIIQFDKDGKILIVE